MRSRFTKDSMNSGTPAPYGRAGRTSRGSRLQAYIDRDLARCHMVLEGESQINITEREIDELALTFSPCSNRWLSICASFWR